MDRVRVRTEEEESRWAQAKIRMIFFLPFPNFAFFFRTLPFNQTAVKKSVLPDIGRRKGLPECRLS